MEAVRSSETPVLPRSYTSSYPRGFWPSPLLGNSQIFILGGDTGYHLQHTAYSCTTCFNTRKLYALLTEYFLVFIKFSQYIATTPLHNDNRSGLTKGSVSVYCEVGTKLLQIFATLTSCLKLRFVLFQVGCRRGPSVRRLGFDSGPAYVRSMVKKWRWDRSFSEKFGCPFSVPLLYNTRLIFHLVILLFVGQIGETWEPSAIGEDHMEI